MSFIPRNTRKPAFYGAALLLVAGALPVQAQPATAAELFVATVLVAGAPGTATAMPEPWDGRGDAGESFVHDVLLPRTAAPALASGEAPQAGAAALFVDAVLKPRR